jgi:hydrogenase maturation protease
MGMTLFLGIGNTLLSDEGIGVHIINHLSAHYPNEPNATFLDGGTLSFTLAEPIATHDNLIVIDAARWREPPGTTRTLLDEEMDRYLSGNRESVHEVGLMDLLDIARLSETLPKRRALIGIQPEKLDWGDHATPLVEAAIPMAAQEALRLHRLWSNNSTV